MNDFGPVISSYSRKQAIEDGVLIDVSLMANLAGIKFPVAVTVALWSDYIDPHGIDKSEGQSKEGRLWDILNVLRFAARASSGSELHFHVLFLMHGGKHEKVELKALCHPGDDMEPVITIMLPNED